VFNALCLFLKARAVKFREAFSKALCAKASKRESLQGSLRKEAKADSPALQGGVSVGYGRVPRARHTSLCGQSRKRLPPLLYPRLMHTLAANLVHCVFSTKDRGDLIREPERTWQYIAGIARTKKIPLIAIGGTSNHVHLLLALPPSMCLAKVVQDLKGNSSRWLNELPQSFAWQRGYGAFSVSKSRRQAVIDYIDGQETHHRKWSFEQEFLTHLRNSKIAFDPHYVFA